MKEGGVLFKSGQKSELARLSLYPPRNKTGVLSSLRGHPVAVFRVFMQPRCRVTANGVHF